jgi:zinc/manganese transport system substrate-binding protein
VIKLRLFMLVALAMALLLGVSAGAHAADKIKAVASFSILGDMVRKVGGDRVDVVTLIGPDGDAHVYEPTPADAKNLAASNILFVNGLGFEGWMDRLEKSSGFEGPVVAASNGVSPRTMVEAEGHHHVDEHAKEIMTMRKSPTLTPGRASPTARSMSPIRDGLIVVDPDGTAIYEANATAYLDAIAKEVAAVKDTLGKLPEDRCRIITSHDAFGYFGAAYGIEVIAPEGVSTESEASAKDVASIIRKIEAEKIPVVFIENITDHRLLDQRPAPRFAARSTLTPCPLATGPRRPISACSATTSKRCRRRCRPSVRE